MLDPLPDSKLIQVNWARPLNRVPSALNKTSEIVVRFGWPQTTAENRAHTAPIRIALRANMNDPPDKSVSRPSVNFASAKNASVFWSVLSQVILLFRFGVI